MKNMIIKTLSRLPLPVRLILRRVEHFVYRYAGRPSKALESSKARARRLREGFFSSYCNGRGLDIGYGGDLLAPNCKGWDVEHGDAQVLQGVKDCSFDFVYSSHTLEHVHDPVAALRNWWRVVRPGGFLLLYIPHRDLYEKRTVLPSRWNLDHKHYFLLDRDEEPHTKSIIGLVEKALTAYEIISARECSEGHTIVDPTKHSDGEYSIEVVLRKRDSS